MTTSASSSRIRRTGSGPRAGLQPAGVAAATRARLGTALHDLATELARERRLNAELQRENRRLRALLEGRGGAES